MKNVLNEKHLEYLSSKDGAYYKNMPCSSN